MATKTTRLGLNKAEPQDLVRQTILEYYNENWDIVDTLCRDEDMKNHISDTGLHVSKDGSLQTGLNAEMVGGLKAADIAVSGHNHDDLYHTKTESDNRYPLKTDVYTKVESDDKFAPKVDTYTKTQADSLFAQIASVYTKPEADTIFARMSAVYTKTESDNLYPLKTDVYTKTESDNKYPLKTDVYTKVESDDRYPLKTDVYTKAEAEGKFISIGTDGVPSIHIGTEADRPIAGTAGRLYITTDTQVIYRDTGIDWQKVSVSRWEDIEGQPTTIAGYGITDAYTKTEADDKFPLKTDVYTKAESDSLYPLKTEVIKSTGGITEFLVGTLASRPAAGTASRLYFSTDTGEIFRDTGVEWELAAASRSSLTEHLSDNLSHGRFSPVADLNGTAGVSIPLGLTSDPYASQGKCTTVAATNADVTILTITATSGSKFVPVDKLGYNKYAFAVRAKTSNATATTAVMEAKVSVKNNAGNYVTLADVSFVGTDFINGTTDYTYLYVPFELRYGLSSGTLLLPLDIKLDVIAKGSTTNNVTISVDIVGITPVVPAVYA